MTFRAGWHSHALKLLPPLGGMAALHGVLLAGREDLALPVLAASVLLQLGVAVLTGGGRTERWVLAGIAAVLLGLQAMFMLGWWGQAFRFMVLPPILLNGWMAYFFGRTLGPGRTPLISRLAALNRGGTLPAPLVAYTRRLTVAWTGFFVLALVCAVVAGLLADPGTWSWVVNVGQPLAAVTLFLCEHAFRAVRFRRFGHNSPLATLSVMLMPGTWREK